VKAGRRQHRLDPLSALLRRLLREASGEQRGEGDREGRRRKAARWASCAKMRPRLMAY
jgi:hypothetical protein